MAEEHREVDDAEIQRIHAENQKQMLLGEKALQAMLTGGPAQFLGGEAQEMVLGINPVADNTPHQRQTIQAALEIATSEIIVSGTPEIATQAPPVFTEERTQEPLPEQEVEQEPAEQRFPEPEPVSPEDLSSQGTPEESDVPSPVSIDDQEAQSPPAQNPFSAESSARRQEAIEAFTEHNRNLQIPVPQFRTEPVSRDAPREESRDDLSVEPPSRAEANQPEPAPQQVTTEAPQVAEEAEAPVVESVDRVSDTPDVEIPVELPPESVEQEIAPAPEAESTTDALETIQLQQQEAQEQFDAEDVRPDTTPTADLRLGEREDRPLPPPPPAVVPSPEAQPRVSEPDIPARESSRPLRSVPGGLSGLHASPKPAVRPLDSESIRQEKSRPASKEVQPERAAQQKQARADLGQSKIETSAPAPDRSADHGALDNIQRKTPDTGPYEDIPAERTSQPEVDRDPGRARTPDIDFGNVGPTSNAQPMGDFGTPGHTMQDHATASQLGILAAADSASESISGNFDLMIELLTSLVANLSRHENRLNELIDKADMEDDQDEF